MFKKQKEELVKVPIGKEAFVFFENKDNPVTNLSSKQIRDIYSGKITNWKEVGGKDEKIQGTNVPETSGSQSALICFMNNPINHETYIKRCLQVWGQLFP